MISYLIDVSFLVLGLAVGVFFFRSLKQTTRLILEEGSYLRIGGLYLLRFALAFVMFYAAARTGLLAALLAVAGFTLARLVVLRAEKTV